MISEMQELHDSYQSIEARKLVDYAFGIADKSLGINKLYDIIKSCADDSEYLQVNKQREMAEFIKKHQNLRIKLNNYVKKIIELEDKIKLLEGVK